MSNETEDSVRSVSTSACVKSELGWGSAPERTRSAIPERQLTVLTQLGQFLRITLPDFSSVAFSATLCRVASLPASPCGALRGTPDPLERHRGRNQPAGSGRPRALRHSISGSSLRGIAPRAIPRHGSGTCHASFTDSLSGFSLLARGTGRRGSRSAARSSPMWSTPGTSRLRHAYLIRRYRRFREG